MNKLRAIFAGGALCAEYAHAATPYAVMGCPDLRFDSGENKLSAEGVTNVRSVFEKAETVVRDGGAIRAW